MWLNDKQSGHGKYIYPNGDVYEGEFFNGKKHGYGEYNWSINFILFKHFSVVEWQQNQNNSFINSKLDQVAKRVIVKNKISFSNQIALNRSFSMHLTDNTL